MLDEAYAAGRKDEREHVVQMLKEELTQARDMARGNGGNPRYDYYADCIEMLLSNFEDDA